MTFHYIVFISYSVIDGEMFVSHDMQQWPRDTMLATFRGGNEEFRVPRKKHYKL